jgi:hypothetical protein
MPGQPPMGMPGPGGLTAEGYLPCPKCNSYEVTRPSFTWWGGVVGPKVICHVVCNKCSHSYNGKSGGSNTGKIVAYYVVVFTILGFIGLATAML